MHCKKKVFVALAFALLLFISSCAYSGRVVSSEQQKKVPQQTTLQDPQQQLPAFVPGEVIVKLGAGFDPRTDAFSDFRDAYHVSEIDELFPGHKNIALANVYKLKLETDREQDAIASLQLNQNVVYAELNYIAHTMQEPPLPNDPLFNGQWYLRNTGQTWGTPDADVDAPEAWQITRGNSGIKIAIIDSGIYYQHEDIAANIWHNPGELPNNGIDDDRNGSIDDWQGWDFVDTTDPSCFSLEDCRKEDNDPSDFFGHGTYVTGIAAAPQNNVGISGVCPLCKIMNLRAGYAFNSPFGGVGGGVAYDSAARAMSYAADNGANILSMSFGGSYDSRLWRDAITYASNQGVILVASAGNSGTYKGRTYNFPAAYPQVLAVAASNAEDRIAFYSSYGAHIAAAVPGDDMLSTSYPEGWVCAETGGYATCSGTSAAAPLLAGIAGLILAQYPGATVDQVATIVHSAVDPLVTTGSYSHPYKYMGVGRINAYSAVAYRSLAVALLDPQLRDLYVTPSIDRVSVSGKAYGSTFQRYAVFFGEGAYPEQWTELRSSSTPVAHGELATLDTRELRDGMYMLKLVVEANDGSVFVDKVPFWVGRSTAPGWPRFLSSNEYFGSSPIIKDVNYDGYPEVFLNGYRQLSSSNQQQILFGLNRNGDSLPNWPVYGVEGFLTGVPARLHDTPIADIDRDAQDEVLFQWPAGSGHSVYKWSGMPQSGWGRGTGPYAMVNWRSLNPPVLADIDNNPINGLEVVTSTGDYSSTCGTANNQVLVRSANSIPLSGWPKSFVCLPMSISAGDLDNDGFLEIVVLEYGDYSRIHVFNLEGYELPGWPVELPVFVRPGDPPPVLADIDNDGYLNIIVPTGAGVHVYNHDGTQVPGWPGETFFFDSPGLAVADIDNDGAIEVVFSNGGQIRTYRADGTFMWFADTAETYFAQIGLVLADIDNDDKQEVFFVNGLSAFPLLYGIDDNGQALPGYPKVLSPTPQSDVIAAPVAGDFDGDGLIEIFATTFYRGLYIWDTNGQATPEHLPWPMAHHDPQQTSTYVKNPSLSISGLPITENTLTLKIKDSNPTHQGLRYLLAMSFATKPELNLGNNNKLWLRQDALFYISVTSPPSVFLANSQGTLNTQGEAAIQWHIPYLEIPGIQFCFAAVLYDETGVKATTNPACTRILPT